MPQHRFQQRAEKAFKQAVNALPSSIRISDLPKTFLLLEPHLQRQTYPVAAIQFRFLIAPPQLPGPSFSGVVLATHTSGLKSIGADPTQPFRHFYAPTTSEDESVVFRPHVEKRLRDKIKRRLVAHRITSFGHAVLLFKDNRAIVFVTGLQKFLGHSAQEIRHGRVHDRFYASQGSGRHLLHLAIAERIVNEMKKKGVEAELHVPQPEKLGQTFNASVDRRIRKPFQTLSQYFHRDTITLDNDVLETINLSKPKQTLTKS